MTDKNKLTENKNDATKGRSASPETVKAVTAHVLDLQKSMASAKEGVTIVNGVWPTGPNIDCAYC